MDGGTWYILAAQFRSDHNHDPMGTTARTLDQLNKVVVAHLDGRRLKGYLYSFSAQREAFTLLPQENPLQGRGTKLGMKDLKAVFFVKDFGGSRDRHEPPVIEPNMQGRKVEVTFPDGERIIGTIEAHNPRKVGFFMFPAYPKCNNIRIFVIQKNVRRSDFSERFPFVLGGARQRIVPFLGGTSW